MRIKITRPDGTVIEAEGTAEECERLTAEPLRGRDLPLPVVVPIQTAPVFPPFYYEQPWWGVVPPSHTTDRITWGMSTGGIG